jgi:Fe-S-cluster-containing dehydrogenase component
MSQTILSRRDFLRVLAAATAAAAALGSRALDALRAHAGGSGPASPHKWVMVIDQDKCIGCGYCTLACQATNDVPENIQWTTIEREPDLGGEPVFVPRPCMHCAHAPCVEVCPVGATYARGDGIVMMDYERCIGCRYCEVACPYGARSFNWQEPSGANPAVPAWGSPEVARRPRGVPEKCSFCYQRIDRGLERGLVPGVDRAATPACVNACPVGARLFGDIADPESAVSRLLEEQKSYRLREDLGTEPRVFYLPKRRTG